MKKLISLLKTSTILTAFCGLLSVGCLINDHIKKAESVSAYESISEIGIQNYNADQNYYVISGVVYDTFSIPNGVDYYHCNLKYNLKFYYTGVNDNMSVDFTPLEINYLRYTYYLDGVRYQSSLSYIGGLVSQANLSLGASSSNYPIGYELLLGDLTHIASNQFYIPLTLNIYGNYHNVKLNYQYNMTFGTNFSGSWDYGTLQPDMNKEYVEYYDSYISLRNQMISFYNSGYQESMNDNQQGIYDTGYQDGYSTGWQIGINQAHETDKQQIDQAYQSGYDYALSISEEFYASASQTSHDNGYREGYAVGYDDGVDSQESVIEEATQTSYGIGYVDGYEQGHSEDQTVSTIFSGILQVALVPINFFLACFNFEILGINLSGFIRALFTIAITVIIIRTIFGGKGASDS